MSGHAQAMKRDRKGVRKVRAVVMTRKLWSCHDRLSRWPGVHSGAVLLLMDDCCSRGAAVALTCALTTEMPLSNVLPAPTTLAPPPGQQAELRAQAAENGALFDELKRLWAEAFETYGRRECC